ncbi:MULTISPECIES: S-formylglutathione hydrolase [Providencia]|uniref:S-formylglutathione hydrolase n=1 Tax=Providencia huaxiensis TaxID=2027290 RepID=A0ABU2IVF8_9GAMM|nr:MULTISPECIES: S-formylglutathione hydrolase [Providencia]MBZ3680040.1 S-formylglutathione hydrolase [Providencia rettgeri]AXH60801.1 S-formylglutathione hydrolase [Providencia huaxiensis]MDT0133038.1 S-formylglutathione hydrolase [Providencia huaxiensis]MDT1979444.1 S-formylglutathione hydrolase [Providencia huaxiensis]QLR02523.1 S-formylglutathione hydrolase [Providencia rettgeri]
MERIERHACFGGWQDVYQHQSTVLGCEMKFAVYLPPQAKTAPCPVIYWLSGLTCNEQNFITKAGAQQFAAEYGVILIAPDTSPRGAEVADDEAYDLGQGAGFYVNAQQAPWRNHYKMYDYIVSELPALVETHLPVTDKRSIFGHSMGGHGALMIGLRNPGRYCSLSAFSPIVAPTQVPWGRKAFTAYLGEDTGSWSQYDTVELIEKSESIPPILVDVGTADPFYQEQLKPELFAGVCDKKQFEYRLNLRDGYDHSYYFISSFIGEHIAFHARYLNDNR